MKQDGARSRARFVVAGVLLDYARLRDHRARPLAWLNDSKQCRARAARRSSARCSVARSGSSCARPTSEIDRDGLHRSNLAGLRAVLAELRRRRRCASSTASVSARLAPEHRAVVDGDEKSAAIAAASIVAKVMRDRYDEAPTRFIRRSASAPTSATSRRDIRPSSREMARRRSTVAPSRRSATACRVMRTAGRAASAARVLPAARLSHARDKPLGGGNELDLVLRRGGGSSSVEVKEKGGPATATRWRWSTGRSSVACAAPRRHGSPVIPSWRGSTRASKSVAR